MQGPSAPRGRSGGLLVAGARLARSGVTMGRVIAEAPPTHSSRSAANQPWSARRVLLSPDSPGSQAPAVRSTSPASTSEPAMQTRP